MKLRNIPFSPPDMTEAEAKEVREAILSGWITTGPRTKKRSLLIQCLTCVGTECGRNAKSCTCCILTDKCR